MCWRPGRRRSRLGFIGLGRGLISGFQARRRKQPRRRPLQRLVGLLGVVAGAAYWARRHQGGALLTAEQTAQLVHDIQREFPALDVSQQRYRLTGDHVVIVHDPTTRHEVRITSLRSNWRRKVSEMSAVSSTRQPEGA